jgi:CBS domain-containing protein
MRVKDCMTTDVIHVTKDDTVRDVAKLMSEHHIGSIPVCDESKNVIGIITDRDIILRSVACDKDIKNTKVTDIMTTNVIRTSKDTDVSWVADIMSKNQIRRVPVVENERLVGMISIGDLVRKDEFPNSKVADCICHICDTSNKNAE